LVQGSCGPFAVDATDLYWVAGATGSPQSATVYKVPLTGGAPTKLGSVTTTGQGPNAVAVAGSSLYFTDLGRDVWTVPTTGGTPTVLAATATDNSMGQSTNALAVGPNDVYFTTWAKGMVLSATRVGAKLTPLVGGLTYLVGIHGYPANVAVRGGYVYWANPGGGQSGMDDFGLISRIPVDGGQIDTIATGQAFPYGIATDANYVYWVDVGTITNDFTDGSLMRAPLGGGTATTLLSGIPLWGELAVDQTDVYVNISTNNALTLAKVPSATGATTPTTIVAGSTTYDVGQFVVDATSIYYCA
jgi:hypothetical protein